MSLLARLLRNRPHAVIDSLGDIHIIGEGANTERVARISGRERGERSKADTIQATGATTQGGENPELRRLSRRYALTMNLSC